MFLCQWKYMYHDIKGAKLEIMASMSWEASRKQWGIPNKRDFRYLKNTCQWWDWKFHMLKRLYMHTNVKYTDQRGSVNSSTKKHIGMHPTLSFLQMLGFLRVLRLWKQKQPICIHCEFLWNHLCGPQWYLLIHLYKKNSEVCKPVIGKMSCT